ncbi:hypothetical protein I7I51_00808 [Histoplasma capsulatum]|uniref:Uncharacterized protein n=1 Tax=Ajellomyces capsulatus TaxID=5037 RepID=A0A8A1MB18_AJECA|nr:hypothetical protein I7I51_00808 [Histoplasma capsulatum]
MTTQPVQYTHVEKSQRACDDIERVGGLRLYEKQLEKWKIQMYPYLGHCKPVGLWVGKLAGKGLSRASSVGTILDAGAWACGGDGEQDEVPGIEYNPRVTATQRQCLHPGFESRGPEMYLEQQS